MTAAVGDEQFLQQIVQYILELRGQGHFLPYQDYEIVSSWVAAATDEDALLLVLSETLPHFFEKTITGSKPKSLLSVNNKILKILKTKAMQK